MSPLRQFSSAFKTSSPRRSSSQGSGYTDRDYEKKREEYLKRANSAHSREMHNIMKGRR